MPFLNLINVRLIPIGIFCLFSFSLFGNGYGNVIIVEDTIVKMHGYIYDSITDNPELMVLKANIILESLPHGSEIGIISSNDSSGYYEYYINLKNNYRIDITSENHRRYFENLDPRKALFNGEIVRDYYLDPEIKENQVIRLNKLIFEQGQAGITPESFHELNKLARLMNEYPSMSIQLEGHTDYRGSKKLNMELSEHRVEAVKNYLVAKGINTRKIKTKAYGGTKPLVKEKSIEASEINRRVEVRILKID